MIHRNSFISITLIVLGIFLSISGCYIYNNSVHPEGNNYQGFPTINSIEDFAPALPMDGSSLTIAPTKIACTELLGADMYRAQMAADAEFRDNLYDGCG